MDPPAGGAMGILYVGHYPNFKGFPLALNAGRKAGGRSSCACCLLYRSGRQAG